MLLFLRDISIVCLSTAQEKLSSVQNEVSEGMSLVEWPEISSIVGKKSIFVNVSHFSASVIVVRKT